MQGDEAFFLIAIRQPEATAFSVDSPFGPLSLMINAYVGTVKSGVMAVLFRLFGPSAEVLRGFGIACLALSGVLLFLFARRFAPAGAAALCALALLFDPAYVITTVLDWGPVALQHVFLLLTMIAAVRAIECRSARWAFASGLVAGLGIWDKALFVFPLAGFATALVVFRKRLPERRLLFSALAGAVLGAAPFLLLLMRPHPGDTASELARLDVPSLGIKAFQLRRTLDGTVLRDFVYQTGGQPASIAGGSRSVMAMACLLAAAALWPVRRSRYGRLAMATLAGAAAAWLSMSVIRDAGLSAHHTVLLWPAPYLLVLFTALAWQERKPRLAWVAAVAMGAVALQNARVTLESRRMAIAHGYAMNWTDAQYALAARLAGRDGAVLLGDWGMADSLYLASRGKLTLRMASDEYWKDSFDQQDRDNIAARLREAGPVTVVYRAGADQFFPNLRAAVEQVSASLGLAAEPPEIIADRTGAPRFELVTYRRR